MPVNIETTEASAKQVLSGFLNKLSEGRDKEAADMGSRFIRQKLRQESFFRNVITPVTLSDDELDRDVNTDLPMKIVEKEPDSRAYSIPFKGQAKGSWFSGPRYAIKFFKIEGTRFKKSKFELMSYQNDIRSILSDNSVKDMADQEDIHGLAALNTVAVGPKHLVLAGGLVATNMVLALQAHVLRKQPIGKLLMSKALFLEALKLPYTTIGDAARRMYDGGVESEEKLWGIPVVTTIKTDIISANDFYVLSPENYLGNFFLLQDATLFLKQEADMIEFHTYESVGGGIGNDDSVTRVTLT
jgi:hypothetical protein